MVILTTFDLDDYIVDAFRAACPLPAQDGATVAVVAAVGPFDAGDALLAPASTRRLIEQFARPPGPAPVLDTLYCSRIQACCGCSPAA